MQDAHFVIIASGTTGDFLPLLAVGRHLKQQGIYVTIVANDYFASLVAAEGLAFVSSGPVEHYTHSRNNIHELSVNERWHKLFSLYHAPAAKSEFNVVKELRKVFNVIVICCGKSNGGYWAAEKFNIPIVLIILNPTLVPPASLKKSKFKLSFVTKLGYALKTPYWRLSTYLRRQRLVDKVRKDVGGKPVGIFRTLLNREHPKAAVIMIGFFPEWFDKDVMPTDHSLHLFGFPFFKRTHSEDSLEKVHKFVERYGPPVLFFPGSGSIDACNFFKEAIKIKDTMKSPAIFLCDRGNLPEEQISEDVLVLGFVDLEPILKLCRAVVHHGGIGIIAESIRAGLPQAVRAVEFDQPWNAYLLCKMGIATGKTRESFDPVKIANSLMHLEQSEETSEKLENYSILVKQDDAVRKACDLLIERFIQE